MAPGDEEEIALADWAAGRPRHGAPVMVNRVRQEAYQRHAPDFSCCAPALGVHHLYRDLYVEGDNTLRLLLALNFLLANAGKRLADLRREMSR